MFITAHPPPKVQWYRQDNSTVTPDARVTLYPNGSLRICHVTPADIGIYTVAAQNEYGQAVKGVDCCSKYIYVLICVLT